MSQRSVYLHIGYPKTATTFLQDYYFVNIDSIHCVNSKDIYYSGFLDLIFDDVLNDRISHYEAIINQWLLESKGKPLLISHESLIGNIYYGLKNLPTVVKRLKMLDYDFKILVTIRRQQSIINSTYVQYIHQGGALSFDNFLALGAKSPIHFSHTVFDYHKVYTYLLDEFGDGKVKLIPMEKLKDKEMFIEDISEFIGAEMQEPQLESRYENESLSPLFLHFLRFSNRFISSWASPNGIIPAKVLSTRKLTRLLQRLDKGKSKTDYYAQSALCGTLNHYYEESNAKLEKATGLRLKEEYNYL